MKRLTLLFCALAISAVAASADETPHWIRYSAISPDARTIAFAYQGDIWTVPSTGGDARRVTSNPAYDSDPIWAPDGKNIIFSSYREMSKDIWVIPAAGGKAVRLTDYPGNESPLAVSPEGKVYFSSSIQSDKAWGGFPDTPQLYTVELGGAHSPAQVTSIPVSAMSVNADGVIVYEDYKGYEDPLRKHHTSSVTRDVWAFNPAAGSFRKLTDFNGEDRNPVFAPDGKSFYYISEADGILNVWKGSTEDSMSSQLTRFKTHPVRFLSAASDGTLCFSWNGDLYTLKDGAEPVKVSISLTSDSNERELVRQSADRQVGNFSISPDGKEVAIVARGDVYVASVDAKSVRRITDTPEQERCVSFGEDGRSVYYDSERDGEWAVWKSSLASKDDKYFSLSYEFKEERMTAKGQTCFQPDASPDGKWLAYLRDRTDIVIKNIKNGEEKVLLQGVNYSYTDGDQSFWWSPDSRSILCNYIAGGGWNNSDVALIDIESGKVTDLTRSGYSDGGFRWALGGKAMTWASDKEGYRSHGSWGTEDDVFVMFFDAKKYSEFRRSKDDEDIEKLLGENDKKAQKEEKKEKKDSIKAADKHIVEAVKLDLEGIEDRTMRLTGRSGRLGDHYLTEDSEKLYYVCSSDNGRQLCCLDVKKGDIKVIKKGYFGGFLPDRTGKYLYMYGEGGVLRMDTGSGNFKKVEFNGADWDYRPAAERKYIFEHCWKEVLEKFYDPGMHGIDWKAMHDNYVQFLPYISNNFDFKDLLSEMLGELNGSHTGARYYYRTAGAPNAGHIGVLYDLNHTGEGLKIAELLPGSRLAEADPEIKPGDVVLAVNGVKVADGTQWYQALAGTVGKRTQLTVRKGGKEVKVYVKPSGDDSEALYRRWVRQREKMVEELSGGRIGYVHVQGMNSASFREVFSKALGKYRNCEALIVDTRHNGGGWLCDDLITFLSGKAYLEYTPRGQFVGVTPFNRWTKPSCVLVGEDNYSDASGFPYSYKALGIGKLIGAPVPGTMTAVWWERQVDPTLVFGIPQVTVSGFGTGTPIENHQIQPDIEVYNTPEDEAAGRDAQLERAVKELLK